MIFSLTSIQHASPQSHFSFPCGGDVSWIDLLLVVVVVLLVVLLLLLGDVSWIDLLLQVVVAFVVSRQCWLKTTIIKIQTYNIYMYIYIYICSAILPHTLILWGRGGTPPLPLNGICPWLLSLRFLQKWEACAENEKCAHAVLLI